MTNDPPTDDSVSKVEEVPQGAPDIPEEEAPKPLEVTLVNYMRKKNVSIIVNGQELTLNHGRMTRFEMTPGVQVLAIGMYDKSELKKQKRAMKKQRQLEAKEGIGTTEAPTG